MDMPYADRVSVVVLACGLLSGCATKEMKSTPFYEGNAVEYVGEASDRVNLWPLAYWRNPVGSVAWPITSFSNDHFALRPVYSQYKQNGKSGAWDEFNVAWPLVQADTKHDDYRAFPFFWGRDWKYRSYQAVFPLYWNGANYNTLFPLWYYGSREDAWTFHTAAGLAGAHRSKSGYRSSWVFPLWYEDNAGLFTTPLYGQTKDSYWVFPLWYKGEKAFVTPLYAQGEDHGDSWWAAPELLSWGSTVRLSHALRKRGKCLLGLGGWYHWRSMDDDRESTFSGWAYPLFDWESRWKRSTPSSSTKTHLAHYLIGWGTNNETLTSFYVFPLYGWWDGGWMTPLGGRYVQGGTTNTCYTPLVGIRSGKTNGGWVLPVWDHRKDADFDQRLSYLDAPALSDAIAVTVRTNTVREGTSSTILRGASLFASDSMVVLLHDLRHTVTGSNHGPRLSISTNCVYHLTETRKRGNRLLFNYHARRTVVFDLKTRARLSDQDEDEASLLAYLYRYEWNRDRLIGDANTRHRVLWRLWDWEDKGGNTSLDVFPGFTYDRRKDGYSKISLLWRLFRLERIPGIGTNVDVLYLPVWR